MFAYKRKVQYYETDGMRIAHHSNYIRWMEEARVAFLESIGCDFAEMERSGIYSPVCSVSCEYKSPTAFSDEVEIALSIRRYTGVRLEVAYEITNLTIGRLAARADSVHCFTDKSGRPINLKRRPEKYDAAFSAACEDQNEK